MVLPGIRKEPNLFAQPAPAIEAGWGAYLAQFPLAEGAAAAELLWPELDRSGLLYEEAVTKPRVPGQQYVTGEASANTFHEGDPAEVRKRLPGVRLVMVLRDPVERAFSHHRMLLRFPAEGRDLGRKIGSLEEEVEREMSGEPGDLLAPGRYVDNFRRWDAVFPAEQRLVLRVEDLEHQPMETMSRVLAHLGLPVPEQPLPGWTKRYNEAPPAAMPAALRQRLNVYFEEPNVELAKWLGW